jgi:AbrB family looped-hinge helix DNA binding protein
LHLVKVTRNRRLTIPREISEKIGLIEGQKLKVKMVDVDKIVIEKVNQEPWNDCTNFLPEDFEKTRKSLHLSSGERFKRLGIVPEEKELNHGK